MIFVTKYEGCPLSILEAYNYNLKNILMLQIPGIENYVSDNCIAKNIKEMADKLIAAEDLTNRKDLSTFFDSVRFNKEVMNFFEAI
jgi:hypothetical protein